MASDDALPRPGEDPTCWLSGGAAYNLVRLAFLATPAIAAETRGAPHQYPYGRSESSQINALPGRGLEHGRCIYNRGQSGVRQMLSREENELLVPRRPPGRQWVN